MAAPKPNPSDRRVQRVQFHTGVQFVGKVLTGVDSKGNKAEMRLAGPGVFITMDGEDYVVPYSNVISTKLCAEPVL